MNKFLKSFGYAFNGLFYAFNTQLNFKVHCLVAIVVIALGLYVDLTRSEWLWIALSIVLVIVVELLNTGMELIVDLLSPERQAKAGAIKDLAAAAVLFSAIFAIAVGFSVFVPKLI
ncbi:MAG: diacylglycerol kinase family protein [Pedobacter sp.]|nr:MAG: diacylglycerol kinase family protein [Pedobacter sp.]